MNEKSIAKADLGMSLLRLNLQFIMVEVIENSLIKKKKAGLARNGNRSCREVVGGLEFAGDGGRSG